MSAKDLALVEDIGGQEVLEKILTRKSVCPKPETVIKRMKELGWDGKVVKAETKSAKAEAPATAHLEEPAEDDYSFDKPAEEDTDAAAETDAE
jgi:hypothetical protein